MCENAFLVGNYEMSNYDNEMKCATQNSQNGLHG